jgi:excisionase family DNA binding protein
MSLQENNNTLMTREEVAEYLSVTERTVLDWAQKELIPAFKLAGSWRFRKQDIDLWLESQRTGPAVAGQNPSPQVTPPSFTGIDRETRIRNCMAEIEWAMQDTEKQNWIVRNFISEHGESIATEAINRLVRTKKLQKSTMEISGEKIAIIKRRTV